MEYGMRLDGKCRLSDLFLTWNLFLAVLYKFIGDNNIIYIFRF